MLQYKVDQFIKQHQLFHHGATVMIGVSGGPDSMALLHYLNKQRHKWGWKIIAVSIDHSLRNEESAADVQYVNHFCTTNGILFEGGKVDTPRLKREQSLGTQEAARQLRYDFFKKKMEQYRADYLVLGHHGDDQIETMVMRLTRSANPNAMKGIPVQRRFATGYIVRPFLAVDKQTIEAYCVTNNLTPRRDPSNEEDVYTRNYFRNHVLPLLKNQNPNMFQSVQKLSEAIQADNEYLDQQANQALNQMIGANPNTSHVQLSINLFKKYPFALQRRMFHLILNCLYNTIPSGLHYGHEQQFFNLLHSDRANASIDLPKDLQIHKSYKTVQFQLNQDDPPFFSKTLPVPGEVTLPSGALVTASIVSGDQITEDGEHRLLISADNWDKHFPLSIRYRKNGDRIFVKGLGGRKKVKDIFIDKKIPLKKRDSWPLLVDQEGTVLWIIGLSKGSIPNQGQITQCIQLEYQEAE
ncbi:tRNA lysidine(34) synthetase TilS [Paraliobacillus ryukyuensis]|uniref:tRNA lysidine(34) synthetase TilS n=1 Tax=Paraliobacillus ryukyuensis TaxID=200904 RepID=UPI0009A56774|nr:tRNA lysidine(34) synthetase TilS [Paraliobacillus ryukyuensis]